MTMPECPFKLPLLFELVTSYWPGYGRISDANGDTVSDCIHHDTASHIVRAVNNFEKMHSALKGIYLDVTFMYEHDMIPYVLDDVTYVYAAAVLKEIEDEG